MSTMREVLCNTSPLLYLHQLGRLDLLPALYARITIPEAVVFELHEGGRPDVHRHARGADPCQAARAARSGASVSRPTSSAWVPRRTGAA